MKTIGRTLSRALVLFAFYLISQLGTLVLGVLKFREFLAQKSFDFGLLEEVIVATAIIGGIALLIFLAKETNFLKWNFKNWQKKDLLIIVTALVATMAISYLGDLGLKANNIESTANNQAIQQLTSGFSLPLLLLFAVIFAPIVEEIIFRAGIMTYVFDSKPLLGLVASTLMFGLMHSPTNFFSWFIYGGMGFVLAFVYHKTKRLELVIIIHMIHNALAILFSF